MRARHPAAMYAVGVAVALIGSSCTGGSGASASSSTGSSAGTSNRATIRQPALSKLNERTRRRLAPNAERVDLAIPSFSEPTKVTNPLFPISRLQSAVLVGKLHGRPWRAETTLLPYTENVEWNGQQVATLQSQFIAFLNGRIFEVAVDHYAQADDGSVWYFGEDAFTYSNGVVADTEGTWLAGVQGPPAMIMPAHPHVGDVYRTENIPGLVFEEVTVKKVGVSVNGPVGPIDGAMIGQELHMDEAALEDKTFAPGYGEFFSGAGRTYEANALAIPVDALDNPTPVALTRVTNDAIDVLNSIRSTRWSTATTTLEKMRAAWADIRSPAVPVRLGAQMSDALHAVARSIHLRDQRSGPHAALRVAQVGLDLQLRYRPTAAIDRARFDLWTRQLETDAAARETAGMKGDVATLSWIEDRLTFGVADARLIDDQLRYLAAATEAKEFKGVAAGAARLQAAFPAA